VESTALVDVYPQAQSGHLPSLMVLWEQRGRPSTGVFVRFLHGPSPTTEQFDLTVDAVAAARALADARGSVPSDVS